MSLLQCIAKIKWFVFTILKSLLHYLSCNSHFVSFINYVVNSIQLIDDTGVRTYNLRPYFQSCWERVPSLLGTKFSVVFPYNSCLAGNELVPSMTKNTASGSNGKARATFFHQFSRVKAFCNHEQFQKPKVVIRFKVTFTKAYHIKHMFCQTLANKLRYVWFKSVHFRRFSLFSNAGRFRKRVRIRAHAGSATFVNVNAYWYVIFTRRNPYFNIRALILYVCEGSSQPIAKCKKIWYLYF